VVSFGTLKPGRLGALPNSEIVMIAESREAAELFERLFVPDIARAKHAEPPSRTAERLRCWLAGKLTFFL